MVDMPMPDGGPPRAIIDASDSTSPAATIERRLSTCVMWKILGRVGGVVTERDPRGGTLLRLSPGAATRASSPRHGRSMIFGQTRTVAMKANPAGASLSDVRWCRIHHPRRYTQ